MPVEPKQAVVCVVWREHPAPQVLMVRRNPSLRFMAGHHVFPGGRIDADDGVAHVVGAAGEDEARAIHAAAREVFEETGILCAEGPLPPVNDQRAARQALVEDGVGFDEVLDRFGLTLDARAFERAGAWLTPSFSPIRFDTRYYMHRLKSAQEAELMSGEISWASIGFRRPKLGAYGAQGRSRSALRSRSCCNNSLGAPTPRYCRC